MKENFCKIVQIYCCTVNEGDPTECKYYSAGKIVNTCFFLSEIGLIGLCTRTLAHQNADSKISKKHNPKKLVPFKMAEIRDELNRNMKPNTALADVEKELRSEEAYNEFLKGNIKEILYGGTEGRF